MYVAGLVELVKHPFHDIFCCPVTISDT